MPEARSNGLDTLRALAIALVFMHHYMLFVSGTPSFGWAGTVGWVGVDLFFVLSGYLITDQVLRGAGRDGRFSLAAFYARRAFRTWPAFWVVLAAYFLWPQHLGGRTPPPLWRFLTFTQNLGLQPGTAFSHAWSLCVEEQFYLVLPLALMAAWRWGRRVRQAWWALGALMALGITARAVLWAEHGHEVGGAVPGYHPNIYYATLCRFDEFLPGIAVALLRHRHPQLWQRLAARPHRLEAAGALAVALALYGVLRHYYVDGEGYGFFMTAFGYSAVAIAFAVLVAGALAEGSWLQRLRIPGVPTLALWSYSIYLSHKAVMFVVHRAVREGVLAPPLEMVAVVAASLVVGALLYGLVERPFMALRSRHVGPLFVPPAAGVASPAR